MTSLKGLIAALTFLSIASGVHAQAVLELRTNWPEALVYADNELLGPAQRVWFELPPGADTLWVVPPLVNAWGMPSLMAPLSASTVRGDTLRLVLDFPYRYRIETIPFGADVYLQAGTQRRLLGTTPLTYTAADIPDGTFTVSMLGYMDESWKPGQDLWNRRTLTLRPVELPEETVERIGWTPPKKRRVWIDALAAATAVTGGVLAVHYKLKADRRYDRYLETGDRSVRSSVRAYDTRAAVALGGMQVGVGVLAVRLIVRGW